MSSKCYLLALPRELRDLIYGFIVQGEPEHRIKILHKYNSTSTICPFISRSCLVGASRILSDELGETLRKHVLYDTNSSIVTKITDLDATHLHGFLRSLTYLERKSIRHARRLLIEFRFTNMTNIHVNRLGLWMERVKPLAYEYVYLRRQSQVNMNSHAGQWRRVYDKSIIVWKVYRDWFKAPDLDDAGIRRWGVTDDAWV